MTSGILLRGNRFPPAGQIPEHLGSSSKPAQGRSCWHTADRQAVACVLCDCEQCGLQTALCWDCHGEESAAAVPGGAELIEEQELRSPVSLRFPLPGKRALEHELRCRWLPSFICIQIHKKTCASQEAVYIPAVWQWYIFWSHPTDNIA